jgi:hypothetical protein
MKFTSAFLTASLAATACKSACQECVEYINASVGSFTTTIAILLPLLSQTPLTNLSLFMLYSRLCSTDKHNTQQQKCSRIIVVVVVASVQYD